MKLTVKPLKQKDAGRGMAAVDKQMMRELGVGRGDYVSISAAGEDGHTIARVFSAYPSDKGDRIIRIDGRLRQEAGVSIDDTVTIAEADVSTADTLTIALPEDIHDRDGIEPLIRDKLAGHTVTEGDTVPLSLSFVPNQSVPLKIVSTTPQDTVVVAEATDLYRSERPAGELATNSEDDDSEVSVTTGITYEDIGGLDEELDQVREMIELPMRHPELFQQLSITPPKGVLLDGPPGTGKTLIAKAVANEVDAHFQTVSGPEVMSSRYGESEEYIRDVFEEAEENAPAIIFFDEIDSIAPSRSDASGSTEQRVVAQLLACMDGLEARGDVTVIAATNRADAIDPALRRPGRFDRELEIGVPDRDGRLEILHVHTREMPLGDDVDLDAYADNTHGFVGADLENLAREGAMNALRRTRPDLDDLGDLDAGDIPPDVLNSIQVRTDDIKDARKGIEPSAFREVFVEVPDVTWDDVGGLEDTKTQIQEAIEWPLDYPDLFDEYDVESTKGVLLYGPPGTGKTLMAKAVANESESNFISIKGPELLSKWVGESEEGIREVFSKARENAPTVVFFDELDAIATERGRNNDGGAAVTERVVSQMLTELDGLEELEDVVVIATSNQPDLIDDALLRPGRLDRQVYIPLPDADARRDIFEVHMQDKPVADDVDLDWLAAQTENYAGADIEAVCREASMAALRTRVQNQRQGDDSQTVLVSRSHFEAALDTISPSVDAEARERYQQLESKFAG